MLQDLASLRGVNHAIKAKLAQLGIHNVLDLLFHFPFRYQDRTHLTPIDNLHHEQEALIEGRIVESKLIFYGKKGLIVKVQDSSGILTLRFFYYAFAMKKTMQVGRQLRCYGTAKYGSSGMQMYHPECTFISPGQPLTEEFTPVYPLTQGVTQRKMRDIIQQSFRKVSESDLPELLGDGMANDGGAGADLSMLACLKLIHSPKVDEKITLLLDGVHPAQYKLALEELTANRLYLLRQKQSNAGRSAPVIKPHTQEWQEFVATLPFSPTKGQEQAFLDINMDLAKGEQMIRLLQGDVGCGKTLVAAYAVFHAIKSGWQAAVMAPTEILAEQHLHQFTEWLLPLGIRIVPLIGKMTAKAKREQQELIANGQADLIIGTHALFQEKVRFAKLGMIVVDEQQRFGVKQRFMLQSKGQESDHNKEENIYPHQLIMTATPIPRTLAQTLMADLDITTIQDMPAGRIPCKTSLLPASKREQLIERLRPQLQQDAQVYWVCPLIEHSDEIPAENVSKIEKLLRQALFEFEIAVAHGRQRAEAKVQAMRDFKDGKSQVLVATTVIEVGVDVPQANFMVIENAERMGLAQLHQLRGRVGRGGGESFCMLLYNEPLSDMAKERLQTLVKSNSGFEIAEADLRLRGTGDIIGTRQSGAMQFKMANFFKHKGIVDRSAEISQRMLQMPEDRQQALIDRWINEEDAYATS